MNIKKEAVVTILQKAKTIALFGHKSPDGDCIGSMLALGKLLEKQKKKVGYFLPDKRSKNYDILPDMKKIRTTFDYKKYDLIVFLDMTSYDRINAFTDNHKEYFDKNNLLIIDHHPENKQAKHAKVLRDIHAASTAEIILEQTQTKRKKYFDKDIATYLYMGLVTDSGNFRYDEDSERAFTNALNLIKLGANKQFVTNEFIRKRSFEGIQFAEILLRRMKKEGDILYSYYQEEELKKYGLDEIEGGFAMIIMQDIQGPKITVFVKKIKGFIKFSLRGKGAVDCNKIAKSFGGGGHRNAAAFALPYTGAFLKTVQKTIKKIQSMIK